ncbi:hypothetical protein [Halostella sp. PRR32]|uniref:hypothetical protein n=1 Tax=Halostella sp. PRR32 TaxID=3098147 RepID=UPI002B1E3A13|nr:hypothetical protein [Halostella sp. PRR32]
MAGRRPNRREPARENPSLVAVGRRAVAVGVAAVALSAPIALLAGVSLFGGTAPAGIVRGADALLRADAASLSGVELVFHVSSLVALVGAWVLGAGLVVEGVFE